MIQQRGVDLVGQHAQQAIDVGHACQELLAGRWKPLRPHLDLVRAREPPYRRAWKLAGDEATGHAAWDYGPLATQ